MGFEVVGYTSDGLAIVHGDVMGDVDGDIMGDLDGDYDMHGEDVIGARRRRAGRGNRALAIPPKPGWRKQLAPGVIQPDEGMVPLPLAPQANGGTFTTAIPQITFQGQLQKPFRAERLLVSVVRTGPTATGRLLSQLFVGTDLQQAEIAGWDIELIGQATAFGTRLTSKAAEPGVLIRVVSTLSSGLTAPDTIFASVMFLGRVVH